MLGNSNFGKFIPKVVLKRNIIEKNCVHKRGDFWLLYWILIPDKILCATKILIAVKILLAFKISLGTPVLFPFFSKRK